ncbi:hypothetical protein DICVIV_00821 [Dictyocaulus viviparus]|uniref:Anaphase-promoting complex subunit 4-like WD40 domain-containing protein n=1 Tax=Dictyocaulus viviparus TaxID=29172 RepID=A0A0D8Y9S3_DICVI|nr:hypothetical protein DICVIV_00821 [Dictyocaulus viviparus]
MCVCPKESLVAVGSETGRIHVISILASSSPLVHLLTRDSKKLSKVTTLAWSKDSKTLYSGHSNGVVLAHQIGVVVATFTDGDIVQLDVNNSKLLVSTQRASYICDTDRKTIVQIGKKLRNGSMGAMFFTNYSETLNKTNNTFILAARPNGRVWEANFAGAVYRVPFILSVFGSHLVIFDVEQSKLVLFTDLEEDISCFCVCGSDIFVLLRGMPVPRKYTLCHRTTVVKRLLAKSLTTQSARFILHFKTSPWPNDLVSMTVDSLARIAKEEEVDQLQLELSNLLKSENTSLLGDTITNSVQKNTEFHPIGESHSESGQQSTKTDCKVTEYAARSRTVRLRRASYESTSKKHGMSLKRASFPQTAADVKSNTKQNCHNLQVTVGNAAKSLAELAISTPTSFSCFLPTAHSNTSSTKRRSGPNIVKAVRPIKFRSAASSPSISSKQFAKPSYVRAVSIVANDFEAKPSIPSDKENISIHDDDGNVQARWVLDRLVHLRGKIGQGYELFDFVAEDVRRNPIKIFERCTSIDDERMHHALFGSSVSFAEASAKQHSNFSDVNVHHVELAKEKDSFKIRASNRDEDDTSDQSLDISAMDWIMHLDARVIMVIASMVIGYHELISVIRGSPHLMKMLHPEHWSALTVLCVREQAMKKSEISSKVISEILHSFNMDRFVSIDTSNTITHGKRESIQKRTPMYSWIIDCNSCCPVCVSSLKSDDGKDFSITSFICGMLYSLYVQNLGCFPLFSTYFLYIYN